MGKGSLRRPMQVSREEFEKNWEAAFGEKEQHEENEEDAAQRCMISTHSPDCTCGGNPPDTDERMY